MDTHVLISAACLGGASLIGSVLGVLLKKLPHKWNDIFLGYCAGMMLAASVIGLILPAVGLVDRSGMWQVAVGILAGTFILSGLDFVTPHLHHLTGLDAEEHHNNATVNRVLLFVLAIAIHKFPEGMATGIVFNGASEHNAWAVTIGIALQNIPEAMVVVSPLILVGVSVGRTLALSVSIAALEVVGVFSGYLLGGISQTFLPFMLALAGGAMLYVVSDEMIPETHSHGFEKQSTYALVLGFITLLFMEG